MSDIRNTNDKRYYKRKRYRGKERREKDRERRETKIEKGEREKTDLTIFLT